MVQPLNDYMKADQRNYFLDSQVGAFSHMCTRKAEGTVLMFMSFVDT